MASRFDMENLLKDKKIMSLQVIKNIYYEEKPTKYMDLCSTSPLILLRLLD